MTSAADRLDRVGGIIVSVSLMPVLLIKLWASNERDDPIESTHARGRAMIRIEQGLGRGRADC